MFKKIFYLFLFFFLSNCSAPGTAFLGPIFTGAKTGSVYQASFSYSTGRILDEVKQSELFLKPEPKTLNTNLINKDPVILLSYVVDKIEISDVIEPEPLP